MKYEVVSNGNAIAAFDWDMHTFTIRSPFVIEDLFDRSIVLALWKNDSSRINYSDFFSTEKIHEPTKKLSLEGTGRSFKVYDRGELLEIINALVKHGFKYIPKGNQVLLQFEKFDEITGEYVIEAKEDYYQFTKTKK